jgi:hypothetical protein
MIENIPDRRLVIRSRVAEGYFFSASSLKSLQHVFTDWFPRGVYFDLTDDTARVDVVAKKEFTSGKCLLSASFVRVDGSVAKTAEYAEEKLVGKMCECFDQKKTVYEGKQDGFDQRVVFYTISAAANRLK